MTVIGTANFVSRFKAVKYYKSQGYDRAISVVNEKIEEGAITIGPPTVEEGQRLLVDNEEGRYFIGIKE